MHFTNLTTATAVAIVVMALSHVALIRVAAAPLALSKADYLRNGQDAQSLNKHFEAVTVQDPCNDGDKACIAGDFAVCSPENTWKVDSCPTSLECFSLPQVAGPGTTISCTTKDDALAQIGATGVEGGINGDGSFDDKHDDHNEDGDEDEDSSTSVAATDATATTTGTPTDLPTATSTPDASDIPEISIPLGDNLSDKLTATTTDAAAATSTSAAEITDFPTSIADSTACSITTVTETVTVSDIPAATSADERSTTRLTTTVVVGPTESASTDVFETSTAQGTASTPNLVTFTTHPFSPIPVSTSPSASASDATLISASGPDATSTSVGYETASTPASVLFTTISVITQPAPSPTDVVPTNSGEPSIPPRGTAPTPDVIVLPSHVIPA